MKKEFTPAEFELIQFDKSADVITASNQVIGPVGADPMFEE